jgi:tetratricopeptide (TPR) repeat protein
MRVTTLIIIIALVGGGLYYAWKNGYIGKAESTVDQSFDVHFGKGQSLYQVSKYEDALKELEKAVALDPKHAQAPDARVRIGDCYKELKQPQKAVETYEAVLKDFPNYKMRGQVEQSIEKVKSLGHF